MPEETLGYIELEWTCASCGAKNPGGSKTCKSCGAAMSQDQGFAVPEQAKLLDQAAAASAAQGPDIHCGYCGARNPAGAKNCTQCGGDLSAGAARQAGQVLGALDGSAAPPPAAAPAPSRKLPLGCIIGAAAAVILVIVGIVVLATHSGSSAPQLGTVKSVQWQRTIDIQEMRPAQHDAWRDEVPSGAALGTCQKRERRMQDQPVPGAEKVCGTAYVVDQGNGKGKVAQQCRYRVLDDYCDYAVPEWQVVSHAVATNSDFNPYWPALQLVGQQRAGNRSEDYTVTFLAGDKTYTYTVHDAATYARFQPGSKWTFKLGLFGGVGDVQPAKE